MWQVVVFYVTLYHFLHEKWSLGGLARCDTDCASFQRRKGEQSGDNKTAVRIGKMKGRGIFIRSDIICRTMCAGAPRQPV